MTKPAPLDLFVFAGEQSGDLHGGALLKNLRRTRPNLRIAGVGGPSMRKEGLELVMRSEEFNVMGFIPVLLSFPKIWKQFHKIRDYILEHQPRVVVLIDYPGFNLRMAKALRKKGFTGKIVQYVCPSVWAWGKHRIDTMAATLDLLLAILPFESAYFSHTSLKVKYIGNPVVETVKQHIYQSDWKEKSSLPASASLIGIFPGSRKGEILKNLPKLLEAISLLHKDDATIHFALSIANDGTEPLIRQIVDALDKNLKGFLHIIPKQYAYELMRDCTTAMATSGTVTLELALHERPTVVVYEMPPFNRFVAKYIMKLQLPHYCLVNIICNDRVFPELIEEVFTSEKAYYHLKVLHKLGPAREACLASCKKIPEILAGDQKVSHNAAIALEGLLQ